jgi:hypothetical protein
VKVESKKEKVKRDFLLFTVYFLLSSVHHHWQYADSAAPCAVVFKPYTTPDLCEKRVVFAEADVEAWREATAALPHENRSAGHDVAVVTLHTQALRIAVAAVA